MWQPSDIKWLDCEISSLCNAGCVDCNRWLWNNETQQMELNSFNQHMDEFVDVDVFIERVKQFPNLKFILIQGNVGDPMTHPKISDIVVKVFEVHPNIKMEINTNGSVGSLKSWQKLCELWDRNIHMVFSIDGLEDTNHIYRRGCDWNKIMRNCQMWNDAGGSSEWKMLNFPYNSHQRDEARALSKKMGFDEFHVRERTTQTEEMDNFIVEYSKIPVQKIWYDQSESNLLTDLHQDQEDWKTVQDWKVKPACGDYESDHFDHWPNFHLNVEGTLWPCCFTSNLPYVAGYQRRQWEMMDKAYIKKYGDHWNNLDHFSLAEILKTDWFSKDLSESWTQKNEKTLLMCYKNCGDCDKSYVWNDPANPIFNPDYPQYHKNKK